MNINLKLIIIYFFFILFFNSFLLFKSETIVLLISFYTLFNLLFNKKDNKFFDKNNKDEELDFLNELDWYLLIVLFTKIKMWYKYFIRFNFIKLSVFYKFVLSLKNYFLYWLKNITILLNNKNKIINNKIIIKRLMMIYKLQKSHKYKNNKLKYLNYIK